MSNENGELHGINSSEPVSPEKIFKATAAHYKIEPGSSNYQELQAKTKQLTEDGGFSGFLGALLDNEARKITGYQSEFVKSWKNPDISHGETEVTRPSGSIFSKFGQLFKNP